MSGGTLIALAADEIVMDPNAVLGLGDPQIRDLPAASIIETAERKKPEHVEDKTLILADMSAKAINQVTSLVSALLEKHLPKEKAGEVAMLMSIGQFAHDFPITVERAKSVGLPISPAAHTAPLNGERHEAMSVWQKNRLTRCVLLRYLWNQGHHSKNSKKAETLWGRWKAAK